MDNDVPAYHRSLFQWHCRNFFNFRKHLSIRERLYLKTCFSLADSFDEVSDGGYEHFSYYTYSHRVKGQAVNSSRIAYGSVHRPEQAFEAALRVLASRDIRLPAGLAEDNHFYGLGWDVEDGLFKVYFRSSDWRRLPPELSELVLCYNWNEHRPEALLSLTWGEKGLLERKVYLYPVGSDPEQATRHGVLGQARMITDTRGEVLQDDLCEDGVNPHVLNAAGNAIVEKYLEIGESLDTIAYQDSDSFTLYFP